MRVRPLFALALAAALGACSGSDEPTVLVDDNEPNDTLAEATPIAIGPPTLGAISPPGDQDYYEFTVPAGGRYVLVQTFDSSGAACDGVDTFAEVGEADGTSTGYPISGDDDSGPGLCAEVRVWLPEGVYYVRVFDAATNGSGFEYAVLVTFEPESVPTDEEAEPNGTLGTANGPYAADALVSGTLSAAYDEYDYFAVTNSASYPRTIAFATFEGAVGYCPSADTVLDLIDSSGYVVKSSNDEGVGRCAALAYQIPAFTTYYVLVSSYTGSFSYLLRIDVP